MATFAKQTLVIGNRSYKVKWNVEHKIHKLICFVLNRNAEVTRIYEHNITRTVEYGTESDEDETETDEGRIETDEYITESDEDGTESDEDGTESDEEITIYGLNEEDEVLKMGSEQLGFNNVINLEHEPNDILKIPANKKELTVQQNIELNRQLVFAFEVPDDGSLGNVYLQIIKHVKSNSIYMDLTAIERNEIVCFENIASRTKLSVGIIKLKMLADTVFQVKDTSEEITFITHNSKQDVQDLLQKAITYAENMIAWQERSRQKSRSVKVEYLFRCKPKKYMDEAFKAEIMRKYMKDNNGDQASSINNKIKGLFFTVTPTLDGTLPEVSFFGDVRIKIKPQDIINDNDLNLYFADFYCLRPKKHCLPPKKRHHVTLVLTKRYTLEDVYCINRLVQLDWKNNLFLKYDETTGEYSTSKAFHFNVEVLYTEDLDLQQITPEDVTPKGQGQSTPGGIPKNPKCKTCNLPFH